MYKIEWMRWTAVNHHPIVNIIFSGCPFPSHHEIWYSCLDQDILQTLVWAQVARPKVVFLPCSASACEHSWSIEGWIHSEAKRRNRIGQDLVDRLVRTHRVTPTCNLNTGVWTSMRLVSSHHQWDIEMTVADPLSDDEDGVPDDSWRLWLRVWIRKGLRLKFMCHATVTRDTAGIP